MIHLYENDPRAVSDPTFPYNMGSFSKIHWNLNLALKKLNCYSELDKAKYIGFSSGLNLNFLETKKKKFLIHVWETNILPQYFIDFRKNTSNYEFFALSRQISEVWESYGFETPIINIGIDTDFWYKDDIEKNDKFTILSVTACNFRSGIFDTIEAFKLATEYDKNIKLIIKDTDDRNEVLPVVINDLKKQGFDIDYICERWDDNQIRSLYNKCHLLCYNPINTSAGIPILESASCELPCIVGNYCPINIYPHSESIQILEPVPISKIKNKLTKEFGLPYTFPNNFIDENRALMNQFNIEDFAQKIVKIKHNYEFYKQKAEYNRSLCKNDWTWTKSANDLIKYLV